MDYLNCRGHVPCAMESCRLRCERRVRCSLQVEASFCKEHHASPECKSIKHHLICDGERDRESEGGSAGQEKYGLQLALVRICQDCW